MTNKQFYALLQWSELNNKQREHQSRSFPSRRSAKSTSHGRLDIKDKRMRVIPGVRIER